MKQLFVSYELTVKLKEKGFKFDNNHYWVFGKYVEGYEEEGIQANAPYVDHQTNEVGYIFAPLYQQVIDWLREKHFIQLCLDYTYYDGFYYGYKWVKSNGQYGLLWKDNKGETPDGLATPEEATIYAIEEVLKMIA